MNSNASQFPPSALLSMSLCMVALVGILLAIWNPELMFSLFGGPSAHSGHTGAWAAVASFFIYTVAAVAAAAGAVAAACVASVHNRRWIWVLAGEVVVLGGGFWAGVERVLAGNN